MPKARRTVSQRTRRAAPEVTASPPVQAAAPMAAPPTDPVSASWRDALDRLREVEEAVAAGHRALGAQLRAQFTYRARLAELGEAFVTEDRAGRLPPLPEALRALLDQVEQLRLSSANAKDAALARAAQEARTGDVKGA